MNRMDRNTTVSCFLLLALALSAIATLPAVSGEDQGYPYVWGIVNIAGTGGQGSPLGVPDATVHMIDVHTGAVYNTTTTAQGKYMFPADTNGDGMPDSELLGQFYVKAEAPGYHAGADASSDVFTLAYYGQTYVKKDLVLTPVMDAVPPTMMGNVMRDNGDGLAGAEVSFYSLDAAHSGFEISTMTQEKNAVANNSPAGYFSTDIFTGEMNVQAVKDGYQVSSFSILVDASGDITYVHGNQVNTSRLFNEFNVNGVKVNVSQTGYLNFTMTPKGPVGEWTISGIFASASGKDITNIRVKLWDATNDREVPIPNLDEKTDSSFSVQVYPATFRLIMDAQGFQPLYYSNIVIDSTHKSFNAADPLTANPVAESVATSVAFANADLTEMTASVVWTLDSDSELMGLGATTIGDPRYRIDQVLGNGDGTVDATEAGLFVDWLKAYGPLHLYTQDYITLSGHWYDPADAASYAPAATGFDGAVVGNAAPMKVAYTMAYELNGTLDESEKMNLAIDNLLADEKVTITVPATLEIMGEGSAWTLSATQGNVGTAASGEAVALSVVSKESPKAAINVTQVDKVDKNNTGSVYEGAAGKYYVKPNVNVTFNASRTTDNNNRTINGQVRAVIESYSWSVVSGANAVAAFTTEEFTYKFAAEGTYTVNLLVKDSSHNAGEAQATVVVDGTKPAVDFTVSEGSTTGLVFNQKAKLNLTASVSDNSGVVRLDNSVEMGYKWDYGQGYKYGKKVTTGATDFAAAGTYKVTLFAMDAAGNEANKTYTVTIKDTENPVLPSPPTVKPDPVKVGTLAELNMSAATDNSGFANLTFAWWFLDNSTNTTDAYYNEWMAKTPDNTTAVVHKVMSEPGDHAVLVKVTDKNGNFNKIHRVITVQGPNVIATLVEGDPAKPESGEKVTVRFNITNTGQVDITSAFSVQFTVDGEDKGDAVSVESLKVGESKLVNFTWTAKKGTFELGVRVDSASGISENNENDNTGVWSVKVKEKPLPWLYIAIVTIVVVVVVVIFAYWYRQKKMLDTYLGKDKGKKGKEDRKKSEDKESKSKRKSKDE